MKKLYKFRAWNPIQKQMLSSDVLINMPMCTVFDSDLIPIEYTGFKDKTEKQIYNGDILKNKKGIEYTIKWSNSRSKFCGRTFNVFKKWHIKQNGASPSSTKYFYKSMEYFEECEIVGNVFENPELVHHKNN